MWCKCKLLYLLHVFIMVLCLLYLFLFQNKVVEVDGTKVKLQVSLVWFFRERVLSLCNYKYIFQGIVNLTKGSIWVRVVNPDSCKRQLFDFHDFQLKDLLFLKCGKFLLKISTFDLVIVEMTLKVPQSKGITDYPVTSNLRR